MIIYEAKEYIIVNKPAGILSQPDKSKSQTISSYLAEKNTKYKNFHPANRIDRNVSGLMILTRTKQTAESFFHLQSCNKIKKKYLAIVKGKHIAESGQINKPLLKDSKSNTVIVNGKGKPAKTLFKRVAQKKDFALLDITLITGRSHQIRVHLSHINHAIIGDKKYAKAPWANLLSRVALQSYYLQFPCPETNNLIILQLPLESELKNLLN